MSVEIEEIAINPTPSDTVPSPPPLVLSSSSKSMNRRGSMSKYVRQVTGRHNDTELHVAASQGDVVAVTTILQGIGDQAEREDDVAEIQSSVASEVNEVGDTPLIVAAEKGFVEVVVELVKYLDRDGVAVKNRCGYDAFHVAVREGHQAIVQQLLNYNSTLSKTFGPSNITPLISASMRGHLDIVNLLLENNSGLFDISRDNGKNALHFAARQGHIEVVRALLEKDPQLARRTDKKGQTALHMAVKGTNCDVVRVLVDVDPAIVMLPDKNGNTALHVATRKKRAEIVNVLLLLPDTHVNALTREHKTAYDIAESLPLSEESSEIKEFLSRYGALRAKELNQPRDELRKTVTEIKNDMHTQLEQTRKTNKNVHGIAKELRKLHREGINNATNSVTVVAVLFATVAFAAIFTVPGGNQNEGLAVMYMATSFKVFYIFNALSLFTSLAVVVVQITLVRGETKSERRVTEVINKLMWLASVCTTVSFLASTYIVLGKRSQWAAILVTLIGGVTMVGVLGTMTYYVIKSKRIRKIRKKEKISKRSGSSSWYFNSDLSESEMKAIYAI
ncbi:Ankyrin repeat-containing protein [Rhynchospora pubera]|uniref:Ankyrin repeat-containing protein n=1 Tax=Rhynchospora pubera TaxID=906938 RepID=A0AAV8HQD6_9POAL|nr:Ankyrin repeat-containing protein [Rhynchospora pubera]